MKLKINIAIILMLFVSIAFAQRNTTTADPITITGNVSEVNHPIATFKADDGTSYEIHMGPYWYWLNNGYKLNSETATIKGEVKTVNGVNELYPIEVTQNGTTIKLADENGIPLWSANNNNGNGRGKGWRNGNGNCCNGKGYGQRNGNGNGRGNCWRNSTDNSTDKTTNDNTKQNNGRGWRQNCPNRNK